VKIVIDSYAWIEHFLGSEKGRKVDEIVESADEVYTPDTVLVEVARKYFREGVEQRIIDAHLVEMTEASTVVCLDAKLASAAANCYLEMEVCARESKLNRPSLFDAIVLAVARNFKAKIVTGDQHFKNMAETLWVG
jgi:predicted nucleic acid-binding protein